MSQHITSYALIRALFANGGEGVVIVIGNIVAVLYGAALCTFLKQFMSPNKALLSSMVIIVAQFALFTLSDTGI